MYDFMDPSLLLGDDRSSSEIKVDHPRIPVLGKNDVHQEQQKIDVRVNTNRSHHGSIDAMPHGGRQLSWFDSDNKNRGTKRSKIYRDANG